MPTFSPLSAPEIGQIWIDAAARVGLRVQRTADAYATSDGRGAIDIGVDDALDTDDAVAQLIFHELCHAITEAPRGLTLPDWGLENADARDRVREHACLRLQAHLCDPFALRALMAPTTEYRAYHDALPAAALDARGPAVDPAVAVAREAAARAAQAPWAEALADALARTVEALRARGQVHALGAPLGPAGETCGSCAWLYVGGRGPAVERCRQTAPPNGDGARTERGARACARWEPAVDCRTCGACCREAYHSVTVSVRDPVVWKQPALVERHGHRFEIRREGPRCAALVDRRGDDPTAVAVPPAASDAGAPDVAPLFGCSIYEDRPQACRDFAAGGRHCLEARRRVGLTGQRIAMFGHAR